jgi:hypothetical protein
MRLWRRDIIASVTDSECHDEIICGEALIPNKILTFSFLFPSMRKHYSFRI